MDSFPDLSTYKALIFDLDGTLINSMPLHVLACIEDLGPCLVL